MDQYTATLDESRAAYVASKSVSNDAEELAFYARQFDRMIASIRIEIWEEGHEAGITNSTEHRSWRKMENPYYWED